MVVHLRLVPTIDNMSPSVKTFIVDAILFDMDGTLIDSTPGLEKAWATFCTDYNLGDPVAVVHETHGRRLSDTLREYCGLVNDEAKLQAEIDRFEEEVLNGGPLVLPGVSSLLSQLSSETTFGWTIVTSATRNYAPRALQRCSIALPRAGLVTSNDVSHGKPHPAPYLAGAEKCGVDPAKCLVVEDAIAGMRSGKAAGALVLAVCTSTPRQTILDSDAAPDYIATDLSKVSARWTNGKSLRVPARRSRGELSIGDVLRCFSFLVSSPRSNSRRE
ncbi:HAD-like domain-containing protein [Mycena vulgaris]|nr:HAD-like domain-containing protein [Mycena vulgaris]